MSRAPTATVDRPLDTVATMNTGPVVITSLGSRVNMIQPAERVRINDAAIVRQGNPDPTAIKPNNQTTIHPMSAETDDDGRDDQ